MITAARLAASFALALALGGCAGPDNDLNQWVQTVKNRPAGAVEPIPDVPEFDKFAYQAHALRDPFAPLHRGPVGAAVEGPKPDSNRPREPLEEFALDSLKMVGTIGVGGRMVALVMDANKVTHRVGAGERMGQREGRVIAVEPSRLLLIELVPNATGGWEETQTVVNLSEGK